MNMKDQDGCLVNQGFGENGTTYYQSVGLKGHTALDSSCGYGSPIHSPVHGYVYSLWTPEHPHPTDGYTAVYFLVNTDLEVAEWSIGHVSKIHVKIGDFIKKGDLVAEEGNRGTVFQNGIQITQSMQKAGDKRGSHRHIQKRPIITVRSTKPNKRYLNTANGIYRDEAGFYYEVYDNNNGYFGCVDWTKPLFTRNLALGMSGYDVYLLQVALINQGLLSGSPTGFFGPMTFASLMKYQKAQGLSPVGVCGPQTRATLNNKYKQL